MAKRKNRATTRRGRSAARGKTKFARGKATKRTVAKRKPKRHLVKTKPKSAGAKKAARKKIRRMESQSTPIAETVIVDVIEEPVPGVITVTEFEATEVRDSSPDTARPDED